MVKSEIPILKEQEDQREDNKKEKAYAEETKARTSVLRSNPTWRRSDEEPERGKESTGEEEKTEREEKRNDMSEEACASNEYEVAVIHFMYGLGTRLPHHFWFGHLKGLSLHTRRVI